MRGVLSPGGTRLAPTEATRRPVACCFERPEQLQYFFNICHNKIYKAMMFLLCIVERGSIMKSVFLVTVRNGQSGA